jgi:hypothetical protein
MLSLYTASEPTPRTAVDGVFRRVPAEDAVGCAARSDGSAACVEIGPLASDAGLSSASDVVDTRRLRIEPQANDRVQVLARGDFPTTPRIVGGTLAQAGPWLAVAIREKGFTWNDVVVDRSGEELALNVGSGVRSLLCLSSQRARSAASAV